MRKFTVTVEVAVPAEVMRQAVEESLIQNPEMRGRLTDAELDTLNVNGMLSTAFDNIGTRTEQDDSGCWLAPGEVFKLGAPEGNSAGYIKVSTQEVEIESVPD